MSKPPSRIGYAITATALSRSLLLLRQNGPGLLLVCAIAALAIGILKLLGGRGFSPMILATLFGLLLANTAGTPVWARAGAAFAARRALRLGIVLLGFQITITDILGIGVTGILILIVVVTATFLVTAWLGQLLGLDRSLSWLIAMGTAICGVAAIAATSATIRSNSKDTAYAVACITLFGSVAMFTYPLLPQLLNLSDQQYGFWIGNSVHEVAQVVAAGFQHNTAAGEIATITKLGRVLLLAPMITAIGVIAARREKVGAGTMQALPVVPWFVAGFIAAVLLNTWVLASVETRHLIGLVSTFLLAMALGAIGLDIELRRLVAAGLRPLLLGLLASLFVAAISLVAIRFWI